MTSPTKPCYGSSFSPWSFSRYLRSCTGSLTSSERSGSRFAFDAEVRLIR